MKTKVNILVSSFRNFRILIVLPSLMVLAYDGVKLPVSSKTENFGNSMPDAHIKSFPLMSSKD